MKIAIIGLGYVGLPLALALSKSNEVIGFDIDVRRIDELKRKSDKTGEVSSKELSISKISFTSTPDDLSFAEIFIIAVPTPVDNNNDPDLTALYSATQTVGRHIEKGSVVIYESTVWPGVTEEICGPILEESSNLKCGKDFFLGYSPERINPGDSEHTVDRITKVVSGQNSKVAQTISEIYSGITSGGIHIAPNIKTAEAAKAIENAQRDINIAFINEIAQICQKLEISTFDVLEAAKTKWNFLDFQPGLVGGHCIGVDPYYLAHCARKLGHEPAVVLTGRQVNDSMGTYIANQISDNLKAKSKILILGFTFKEDVPDIRNSQVIDIVFRLRESNHTVIVHDPYACNEEAQSIYDITLEKTLTFQSKFDCVLCCVSHSDYRKINSTTLEGLLKEDGLLGDVKGIWRNLSLKDSIRRWAL
tara:strand:- start:27560 stop:28816 length:1257 start_codon:yes stop_codon:yes gene_type:complete